MKDTASDSARVCPASRTFPPHKKITHQKMGDFHFLLVHLPYFTIPIALPAS